MITGLEGQVGSLAAGALRVRAYTWKALLAVPPGPGDPVGQVTTATQQIAIRIPDGKDDQAV